MVYKLDTGQTQGNSFNISGQLLYIVENPVTLCTNCVCQYCSNNVEELWNRVQPEEVKEFCFNCDGCFEFTGDACHKAGTKRYCEKFVLSDYGADRNREHIKLLKTGNTRKGN